MSLFFLFKVKECKILIILVGDLVTVTFWPMKSSDHIYLLSLTLNTLFMNIANYIYIYRSVKTKTSKFTKK